MNCKNIWLKVFSSSFGVSIASIRVALKKNLFRYQNIILLFKTHFVTGCWIQIDMTICVMLQKPEAVGKKSGSSCSTAVCWSVLCLSISMSKNGQMVHEIAFWMCKTNKTKGQFTKKQPYDLMVQFKSNYETEMNCPFYNCHKISC